MSSIAGWISRDPVPLRNLAMAMDYMRKMRPEIHNGPFGTQIGVFFSHQDDSQVPFDKIIFGGIPFDYYVDIVSEGDSVLDSFHMHGLNDMTSTIMLAEQTTAEFPTGMCEDPSLIVQEDMVFAACGHITPVMKNTEAGQRYLMLQNEPTSPVHARREQGGFFLWTYNEWKTGGFPGVLENIPAILRSAFLTVEDGTVCLSAIRKDVAYDGTAFHAPSLLFADVPEGFFVANKRDPLLLLLDDDTRRESICCVGEGEIVQYSPRDGTQRYQHNKERV